jgi:dihydrofolate synthase/folylpolyglutamate synthase
VNVPVPDFSDNLYPNFALEELETKLFSYAGRMDRCLDTMRIIDAWMGHPHCTFPTIHIAGTNGKGSVAIKMAKALESTGRRVGLYTSPHLATFRERAQINGEIISEEFVLSFLPRLFSFVEEEGLQPTFFELLTALAFSYFAREKVDIAVIETGLGGRLDATNVIMPILSIITSISLEHTEILGATLEEILKEKEGIIKPGVPVVRGSKVAGFYDLENRATARKALEILQVPEEAISLGLLYRPPCRFEIAEPSSPVILDVAHNPDGLMRFREALEEFYPGQKFHVYLALGKTKDLTGALHEIEQFASKITFVSNGHPRLRPGETLDFQLDHPAVVCGSFYIMEEARRVIQRRLGERGRLTQR